LPCARQLLYAIGMPAARSTALERHGLSASRKINRIANRQCRGAVTNSSFKIPARCAAAIALLTRS
jgi:hypothetical protein